MATSTEDLNIPEGFLVAPRVPQGLAAAVEGLTREVIRQRPEDIYVFAAHHFEKLLHLREAYGVSRSLSVDERNLQALRDMSEALRKRDAFREERNTRDYAYQSGWSLNETAKVLERHRSIFGDEGRKISTDEIRQLAYEKEREHFRRHRSMEKRSSSKRKEEFKESSGNGKNGLKLIAQIPNLPGSSSVKDIKSELRKNRISSRERRSLLDKNESESLKSTGRTLDRKERKLDEMESRHEEMEQAGKRKRLDRKSKGLSMDRVKDFVVKKFSTTKSLEELQSPTYVEKVQEVIDETAPIIKERVEELKNTVNSKKIRSLESERSSFSSEKSKSKESSGRSTIEESGGRSRSDKLKSKDKSKETREELKVKESRIKEQKSRKSMKSTSKASEVETPNDSLEDVDTLKSEVESIGSKNGLEMRLNETQTLLEGISSAFQVPVRRSSSAKDLRNRMSEASDVSLPVVRPLSSKAHSRSVSRSDSDNLVLPPISPDAPKSVKVKEDLVLPVLSRPGSSNPEKEADVTIKDDADSESREMEILGEVNAEKENSATSSKHSGEEVSNKVQESENPKDDASTSTTAKDNINSLPLSPKELNTIEAEIEEVFRDSLNVTPEPSETPSRPDSLEPEVQQEVLQDSSSVLKEQLLEIEEVEKNIQSLLDPKDNQPEEEVTILDKLQELENSERRIDDILQEAGKSESVAEKLKALEEVEQRIDSFLDEPGSFVKEQKDAIELEEELVDENSKGEEKEKQEDTEENAQNKKEEVTTDESEKEEKEQDSISSGRKDDIVTEEAGGISQIPHSFVLTEGSPYEIPDTVTTVIIPDRISTPDSDILEVEVENGEVRSRMTPNTFKIEDQDELEDNLIQNTSNLNIFGEVIEPEPSSAVHDIDLISGTKSGLDILIPHQDLDQIKEEDDKDLDKVREEETEAVITMKTENETELQQIIEEVADKLEEDKETLEEVVDEVMEQEINKNDENKTEELTDVLEKVVEELAEAKTDEIDGSKIEDDEKVEKVVVDKIEEDVTKNETLQERIEETENKDEIQEPGTDARKKVEEDTDQKVEEDTVQKVEISEDKIEQLGNEPVDEDVKIVVDIDEEELRVLQVMTSSLKEIQESESGEKLTEDDKKTKDLPEDLSPEVQRITDSESTDETKETSITDGIQETTDIVENSLEIEESTGRSIESTNEVKETTMSDQSNMSLSLDPGVPIVPELNLDSLQDITISSFKMTDEEVEKKENEETESIFSTTEPEMSVTNGKLVEVAEEDTAKVAEIQEDCQKTSVTQLEIEGIGIKVENTFTSEENQEVDIDTEKGNDSIKIEKIEDETYPDDSQIQEVFEEMLKEQVEVKEDPCVKASSYVTTLDNEDEIDKDSKDPTLVQNETSKELSLDEQTQIIEEKTKDQEKEVKDVDTQEEANKIDLYDTTELITPNDEEQTSDPKVEKEASVQQGEEERSETVDDKHEEEEISKKEKSTVEEILMKIDENIPASSDAETEKTGDGKIQADVKTIVLSGNETNDQTEAKAEAEQNAKTEEKREDTPEHKELTDISSTNDAEEIFTETETETILKMETKPSLEETTEPNVKAVKNETTVEEVTEIKTENESNVLKEETQSTNPGENEEQEQKIGAEKETIDIKIEVESEVPQTDEAIEKDESRIIESRSASQCTTRRVNSATNVSKEEQSTNNDELLDKYDEDNESELKLNDDNKDSKIEETIKAEVVTDAVNDDNFDEKKKYHIYVPELNESENSVSDTSSFVTAATKIQAGIRGFLIRRRLQNSQGRSSTLDSVPSIQESFVVESGTTEQLLSTIEEVTQPVKSLDRNSRQSTNRKRLRREDAIQRTTLSLDNAFAEGGLQHTGEFHDCIPLPVFHFENQHHLRGNNITPKRKENEDRVREKKMEDDDNNDEGRRDQGKERTKSVRRQNEVKENGEETVERIEDPKGTTELRKDGRNGNNGYLRSGKIGNSVVEDETREAKMTGCNGFRQRGQSAKGSQISKNSVENTSLEKEHKEREVQVSKRNGGFTRSNELTQNIARSQEKKTSTERNSLGKGKHDRKIESDKESRESNGESTSREHDDATNGRNNIPKRNNGIKPTELEKPTGRIRFPLRKERETKSAREIQERFANQSEKTRTERRENIKKREESNTISTRREKINGIEKASQTIIVGQLMNGEVVETRQTKSADLARNEEIINEHESVVKEVHGSNLEKDSSESKNDIKDNFESTTKHRIGEVRKDNCGENSKDNTKANSNLTNPETLEDKPNSNEQEPKYKNPKNYFSNQGIYPNGFAHPPNLENVFPNESSFNLDFNPKLGPILDILFSKEDQMLESNYLNFITSVEDNVNQGSYNSQQSSKKVEIDREHSGSIREPLALPGSPKGIIIEDVTSLEEATMRSSIFITDDKVNFIVDNSSLDAKDEEKKLEEFLFLEEALLKGNDRLESEIMEDKKVGYSQEYLVQEANEGDKKETSFEKNTQEPEEASDVERANNQRGNFFEKTSVNQKENTTNIYDTPFRKNIVSCEIEKEPTSKSRKLTSPKPKEESLCFQILSPKSKFSPDQKDDFPNFEDSSLLPDASLSTLSFSMNIDDVLGLGSEEEPFHKASSLTKLNSNDLGSSRDSQNSQLCLETAQSPVTMMQMESGSYEEKFEMYDKSSITVERRENDNERRRNKGSGEKFTSKHDDSSRKNGNFVMNVKERKSMEMKEMASPRVDEID